MLVPVILSKGMVMLATIGISGLSTAFPASGADSDIFPLIALVGGFFIATLLIVMKTVRVVVTKRAAEETKREIAAYVAEGSIRPEDAALLINAGADAQVEKITAAVAAGIISPSKAEKLIASLRNDRCATANL